MTRTGLGKIRVKTGFTLDKRPTRSLDTKIKSVACPEVELLHHEEVHHLFREVDHVVDTYGNVVVRTKRDHFSKYAPKRSNHANFQLLKIKNKKVMTKKPLIVEKSNPLWPNFQMQ